MKFAHILCCAVLVACLLSMVPSPAEAGKKKAIKSAALLALVLKNHFHKQLGFFPLPLPIPVAIEQKLPPKYPSYPSYPSYPQQSYSQPSYAASYQEPTYSPPSYSPPSYSPPSYEAMDSYATNDHQSYSNNNNNNNNQQYDLSQYASADEGQDYAPQY